MAGRRILVLFVTAAALILIPTYFILSPESLAKRFEQEDDFFGQVNLVDTQEGLSPDTIMPKMRNETAKAELGRAGWKLLHTMGQRYPDHPTPDERQTFKDFLFLFSRMYPCGECASHFQLLLKEYPPQTSSKNTASLYLCMLHNKVNVRLKKPDFDCSKLEGLYDCGCGDEDAPKTSSMAKKAQVIVAHSVSDANPPDRVDPITGQELVHG